MKTEKRVELLLIIRSRDYVLSRKRTIKRKYTANIRMYTNYPGINVS